VTLSLDYTLCENGNCPSAVTCDRYQTLASHYYRIKFAVTETEKAAAAYNIGRIWLSDFRPDARGRCDDYIGVMGEKQILPERLEICIPVLY
jgi:hypothetical protein